MSVAWNVKHSMSQWVKFENGFKYWYKWIHRGPPVPGNIIWNYIFSPTLCGSQCLCQPCPLPTVLLLPLPSQFITTWCIAIWGPTKLTENIVGEKQFHFYLVFNVLILYLVLQISVWVASNDILTFLWFLFFFFSSKKVIVSFRSFLLVNICPGIKNVCLCILLRKVNRFFINFQVLVKAFSIPAGVITLFFRLWQCRMKL